MESRSSGFPLEVFGCVNIANWRFRHGRFAPVVWLPVGSQRRIAQEFHPMRFGSTAGNHAVDQPIYGVARAT